MRSASAGSAQRHRSHRSDRSGRQGLLQRRRPECEGKRGYIGEDGVPRLNVLDLHQMIRSIPKPVIAMVNGYSIGGGNVCCRWCATSLSLPKTPASDTDRTEGRKFRRRIRRILSGPLRRPEESTRDMVPLQTVYRPGGPGDGEW